MRILGIDPGLRKTGFGVIDAQGQKLSWVASGTIVIDTDLSLALRLKVILDNIREIADRYHPDEACIEKVFVNTNPNSTLLLGQARGACLCALADSDLEVTEYTALQIKKSVVGKGHADKTQVQTMVKYLLNLNSAPSPDAADALACAICHAHTKPLSEKLQGQSYTAIRAGRFK
ncbi:crossover junction endodeoxyribonuclease RuvC [Basilea psittacipulmonis]|uniref:Crossover junction endodeoxyribonuclease RuvC n=1 Tax=Basilea psittacipulmonis DSM 24701 TaxID=1072685 RepID=A0A077DFX6_9BURK|nr:crossover junction endodeoxyribonuclease RuvC [Basilea psittacipulmonis]AIL33071.1 Holliday junction resolvase [Basilea psittacipulmonis DSM 24701]